jgi:hypothetical protein
MRKFEQLGVIDEVVASYRREGWLVGLTPTGNVIVELERSREIELRPHQVALKDPPRFSFTDMTWEILDFLSE